MTAGCCSLNDNGPVSPALPPESGLFPDDGAFALEVTRGEHQTDTLVFEIRRWLPCSESPERCGPDLFPGDVYADPDNSVTRTVSLDEDLLVVIRPIPCGDDGTWTEVPIEGDGAALGALLGRLDAAAMLVQRRSP